MGIVLPRSTSLAWSLGSAIYTLKEKGHEHDSVLLNPFIFFNVPFRE